MLGWLEIRLRNFFLFSFFEVISVLWLGLQVWQINSGNFFLFLIASFNIKLIENLTYNLFWFVFYEFIIIL
jgi:hypothetical protein